MDNLGMNHTRLAVMFISPNKNLVNKNKPHKQNSCTGKKLLTHGTGTASMRHGEHAEYVLDGPASANDRFAAEDFGVHPLHV